MRAFLVNPNKFAVEQLEIEPTPSHLNDLVGGFAALHYIVAEVFPECLGYVNTFGLTQKRRLWFFRKVHVWGPMIILDPTEILTLDIVRDVCTLGA